MRDIKERIISYYLQLPKKKQIIFLVSVAIIFISLVVMPVGRMLMKPRKPGTRTYLHNLSSNDKQKKCEAISWVGGRGVTKAVPILVGILEKDSDSEVRKKAAMSLNMLNQELLHEKLNDEDVKIKESIVDALLETETHMAKMTTLAETQKVVESKGQKTPIPGDNLNFLVDKFTSLDSASKGKVLAFIQSSGNSQKYEEKILTMVEDTNESLDIRKKGLEILWYTGTGAVSSRLTALTYTETDLEFKNWTKAVVNAIGQREQPK